MGDKENNNTDGSSSSGCPVAKPNGNSKEPHSWSTWLGMGSKKEETTSTNNNTDAAANGGSS